MSWVRLHDEYATGDTENEGALELGPRGPACSRRSLAVAAAADGEARTLKG